MKSVYLDYAASTPLDQAVISTLREYSGSKYMHNPSALYRDAVFVRDEVSAARDEIASCLGVKGPEIVFAAGGTEANNLALFGILRKYQNTSFVISTLEHSSVYEPAQALANEGHAVIYLPVDGLGLVKTAEVKGAIKDDTALVSVMAANNEIGTVQPIREIARIVRNIREHRKARGIELPIYLHCDACQATNYLDVSPHRLGVDLMTVNASKIYGPKQIALLYVRRGIELRPILYGGGQEMGLRSGTESVMLIKAFAQALKKTFEIRKSEAKRLQDIRDYVFDQLKTIHGVETHGSLKHRLPNNLYFSIAGQDNERLLYMLDEKGFQVATGAACNASSIETSRVMSAIGKSDMAASSLRVSMGRETTRHDMDRFIKTLKTLVA